MPSYFQREPTYMSNQDSGVGRFVFLPCRTGHHRDCRVTYALHGNVCRCICECHAIAPKRKDSAKQQTVRA